MAQSIHLPLLVLSRFSLSLKILRSEGWGGLEFSVSPV